MYSKVRPARHGMLSLQALGAVPLVLDCCWQPGTDTLTANPPDRLSEYEADLSQWRLSTSSWQDSYVQLEQDFVRLKKESAAQATESEAALAAVRAEASDFKDGMDKAVIDLATAQTELLEAQAELAAKRDELRAVADELAAEREAQRLEREKYRSSVKKLSKIADDYASTSMLDDGELSSVADDDAGASHTDTTPSRRKRSRAATASPQVSPSDGHDDGKRRSDRFRAPSQAFLRALELETSKQRRGPKAKA
eukprot:m.101747 g.101747  ORF g.101747 m.101747 type:complete len:253 (-) comp8800_c0_seq4:377-1135(-)